MRSWIVCVVACWYTWLWVTEWANLVSKGSMTINFISTDPLYEHILHKVLLSHTALYAPVTKLESILGHKLQLRTHWVFTECSTSSGNVWCVSLQEYYVWVNEWMSDSQHFQLGWDGVGHHCMLLHILSLHYFIILDAHKVNILIVTKQHVWGLV